MPREDGVKGCCLLKKTTLLHKLTLGVLWKDKKSSVSHSGY
jgi:hypothetical protein